MGATRQRWGKKPSAKKEAFHKVWRTARDLQISILGPEPRDPSDRRILLTFRCAGTNTNVHLDFSDANHVAKALLDATDLLAEFDVAKNDEDAT